MQVRFKPILTSGWTLPVTAVFVALLNGFGLLKGFFADTLYYKYLYQLWRIIYDHTFGLLPFPTVYILFILLFPLLYFIIIKPIRNKNWKSLPFRLLNLLAAIYILFYFLWGFNYQQMTLVEKLDFPEINMAKEDLFQEIMTINSNLVFIRQGLKLSNDSIRSVDVPSDLETIIRKNQKEILDSWSLPAFGKVRVRKLLPKGTLLRISTAGVYIPFVSEGHIDAGLHPVQWPFTMAHEMAHGYGVTDEGECNFVAFVTCMNAENSIIRYSGTLGYFRYLLSNYRIYYRDEYDLLFQQIDSKVIKDIVSINNELNKYPDILPDLRDKIYDSYLKSNGVEAGLHSYSTIIQLVNRWKKSNYNQELVRQIFPSSVHE